MARAKATPNKVEQPAAGGGNPAAAAKNTVSAKKSKASSGGASGAATVDTGADDAQHDERFAVRTRKSAATTPAAPAAVAERKHATATATKRKAQPVQPVEEPESETEDEGEELSDDGDEWQEVSGDDDEDGSAGDDDGEEDEEDEDEDEEDNGSGDDVDDDDDVVQWHLPEDDEKPLSKERLAEFQKEQRKKGVVYLSRVPPFMKPTKVKFLLSRYGEIGRVYLVEEDAASRKRRVKGGGNKKVKYVEGWVEFGSKKVAKAVAAMLNNTQIGGKKRSHFHDDLWNMKYLSGFKWHHLTEKLSYEKRLREQQLRLRIAQAKKDNAYYVEQVQKAHELDRMEERKLEAGHEDDVNKAKSKVHRTFKQFQPIADDATDNVAELATKLFPASAGGPSAKKRRTAKGEQ